jgi:hypothetical protein
VEGAGAHIETGVKTNTVERGFTIRKGHFERGRKRACREGKWGEARLGSQVLEGNFPISRSWKIVRQIANPANRFLRPLLHHDNDNKKVETTWNTKTAGLRKPRNRNMYLSRNASRDLGHDIRTMSPHRPPKYFTDRKVHQGKS